MNSSPVVKYPSWLYDALSSVLESAFTANAESCDRERVIAQAAGLRPWLQARVHFAGGMEGEVICTAPEQLVKELAAAFAGLEPGEPIEPAMVDDLMGEFANMVCGKWLMTMSKQHSFDLGKPVVARLDQSGEAELAATASLVNGKPALVRVVITGW